MRFLAVCLALALGGCAHQPLPAPATAAPQVAEKKAPDELIKKILAGLFEPEKKADEEEEDICEGKKPCIVEAKMTEEVDEDSVKVVLKKLHAAEKAEADHFVLELDTPGGSVPAGFQLAKALERSSIRITCVVDGDAASMGGYLLQSCPVRVMTKRSMQMYHEVALGGMFQGQPNQWAAIAQRLAAMRIAMAEHCTRRTKMTVAEFRARTDGSQMLWLNWEEAKKLEFVDKVVGTYKEALDNL